MDKQLIVGVDPGTTVGLAFLDVDGNVIRIKSSRNLAIDSIITEISSLGKAIIIATDKAVVPPVINKLASILSARIFSPDTDLLIEKKRELASKAKTNNDHERDALAAAIYAYNRFQNKLRRVEKQVFSELEEIKGRVLRGEKVSEILEAPKETSRDHELLAQIKSLRKENRELEAELVHLRKAAPKPNRAILRKAAKEARGLVTAICARSLVMLHEVPALTFLELKNQNIKKGDIVLCRGKEKDSKGIRFLESRRVFAIIFPKELDSLAPTCTIDNIDILCWEGLFFANPLDIEKACGRRREVAARDLEDMLINYKKGRR